MPSPAVSLVVTDLDGTLWHTDDAIDPTVVAAVATLAERGVPLLVATGRRLATTRRPLASVGLTPPAVVLNGALGVDLATGDRFHRAPFPTDEARAVLRAFRSVGLDPVVYLDHPELDAVLSATPSTHPDHARAIGGDPVDLDEVVATLPVLGFSMIGRPHAECVAARDAVGPRAETHLDRSLDFPGLATLTVAPEGQSKWDGVLAFCAAHGIDSSRVLALADGTNDVELLDGAAVRLVPEVAHQVALDRADHVIPAAADGGWVAVLDHV
jgi:hydroxymethylpyrimidine pyrophosphatase-like HAD family hydrolase